MTSHLRYKKDAKQLGTPAFRYASATSHKTLGSFETSQVWIERSVSVGCCDLLPHKAKLEKQN